MSGDRIIYLKSDDCKKSLSVKQSLLIKSSKYFKECAAWKSPEVSLTSNKVPFVILEMMIGFLEAGKLQPKIDTLERLFVAANYLQMGSVLRELYDHLEKDLAKQDPQTVEKGTLLMYLRIFNIVRGYCDRHHVLNKTRALILEPSNEHKCQISLRFILAIHFDRIMFDKTVLQLDLKSIHAILYCNVLVISEADVLKTIKMWINHDFAARQEHFQYLLECVYYDPDWKTDFLVDEFLCGCIGCDECSCLPLKDFLISFMMIKEGVALQSGMFQITKKERFRGTWKLPKAEAANGPDSSLKLLFNTPKK